MPALIVKGTYEIPYKLKEDEWFKLAKADGWDAHTGKTINYRASIGQLVKVPDTYEVKALCSPSVLHATKTPLDWLDTNGLPCSLFIVQGQPVTKDKKKAGFTEFKILKEIPAGRFDKLFGFKYSEAINPFDPRTVTPPTAISTEILGLLKSWDSVRGSVWGSVWGSVRGSVLDSVRDSVRDSVWSSVRGSVWDSVRGSVWGSVWGSEAAYIGTLFPSVTKWKYVNHEPGIYPFQPAVELIKLGIIPVYDGYKKEWYLCHPKVNEKAEILWKGPLDVARRVA